jgi:hypothetical protein
MAKQTINLGSGPNTKTGDPLRTAFTKINDNFTEVYGYPLSTISSGTPASSTATGTKGEVKYDSSYVYICIATNSWIRITRAVW